VAHRPRAGGRGASAGNSGTGRRGHRYDEFKAALEKAQASGKFTLVDVREPNETAAGFVRGAELMPYTSGVFARDHGKIAKDPPVLVYCASGARARRAAELLIAEGWKDVIVLSGGGYEDLRSLPAR
jgi:rhodanese-related sulfurtransferase